MEAQTVRWERWIVVDDCRETPTKCTLGQDRLESQMQWEPGINTQRANLDTALTDTALPGQYLFVIEDDDYYSPHYLEEMMRVLDAVGGVVGLSNSPYYHLQIPGFRQMQNYRHASLSQTGVHPQYVELLYKAVHSGQYYIDIDFWKTLSAKRVPTALISDLPLSVGIKGMPGRVGLGAGHSRKGYSVDRELKFLKKWLGEDHNHYVKYLGDLGVPKTESPKSWWQERFEKTYGYQEL